MVPVLYGDSLVQNIQEKLRDLSNQHAEIVS